MDEASQKPIVEHYRRLLDRHGAGPAVGQWSFEGQQFRFDKLTQVGPLANARVLDLGCGLGDLYPFLTERFGRVAYSGIDIVPELVSRASATYPDVPFACLDVLAAGLAQTYDYVLMSGVFNNARPDSRHFLEAVTSVAFRHCEKALAFNFISRYVNDVHDGIAYHDPVEVARFCIENLSHKIVLHHHYERCDVAVFVYR